MGQATHRQIAVVLNELAEEVEALGAALCGDMDIAMRHMDKLQAIDLIAQKQRSLGTLLVAESPAAEVERIAIDVLRDRMRLSG
ncbi:Carrier domain-containing protein [Novosphingobium lubricantis]|jgi:CheY-like chemotaxis protein